MKAFMQLIFESCRICSIYSSPPLANNRSSQFLLYYHHIQLTLATTFNICPMYFACSIYACCCCKVQTHHGPMQAQKVHYCLFAINHQHSAANIRAIFQHLRVFPRGLNMVCVSHCNTNLLQSVTHIPTPTLCRNISVV